MTLQLKPQTQQVLTHLQQHGHITAVEAAAVYKIRSLTSRVSELTRKGHAITRETRKDGAGQRYVRYAYAARVGARILVTNKHPLAGDFYENGAGGVIVRVDGAGDLRVRFDSGTYLVSGGESLWWLAPGEVTVIG